MDDKELGSRIKLARERAGKSQSSLGLAVDLDRWAIGSIERGDRHVRVAELLKVAEFLGRPLAYFVAPPVPAVVSRRQDSQRAHETTALLDDELGAFAADVAALLRDGVLDGGRRREVFSKTPRDHQDAENKAQQVRARVGLGASEVVDDPVALAEELGMVTYTADLTDGGPDGACVEVGDPDAQLGAAIVNGRVPIGRFRMTVVHELGHWLSGDAFDREATGSSEKMLNSFGIHFLMPRAGLLALWGATDGLRLRDRAVTAAGTFKVSWSAALLQLRNVGLIDQVDYELLGRSKPTSGDFAKLGIGYTDAVAFPDLSPGLKARILGAYSRGRLTHSRTTEVLRGAVSAEQLPAREASFETDLEAAFSGHDR